MVKWSSVTHSLEFGTGVWFVMKMQLPLSCGSWLATQRGEDGKRMDWSWSPNKEADVKPVARAEEAILLQQLGGISKV